MDELIGRQWLANQEDITTISDCKKVPAIQADRCQRCGSQLLAYLPSRKRYCRSCLGIGRVSEDQVLVRNLASAVFPKNPAPLTWQGKLTKHQAKISQELVNNYRAGKTTLVHAVTGAGKTEMLFPLLAACLKEGKRAAVAAPRIDVINELFPRLSAAFAQIKVGCYHGKREAEPGCEQLTLLTTHQLLKFYQAFDLLIIDEVDSFPYAGDPVLHFGAKNAVKTEGVTVYLTATPTSDLLAEINQGKIAKLTLKRRFHGQKLPVPKEKLFLRPYLIQGRLNPQLTENISRAIKAGHPLLLFVPKISEIPAYLAAIKADPKFAKVKLAGVHAADPERFSKVEAFRRGELEILVTTTILERGVTFKHVWVIILAADDRIYSASSLVQIAGRVGRASDDPTGLVLFCYHRYTHNIRQAMQEIQEMNQ